VEWFEVFDSDKHHHHLLPNIKPHTRPAHSKSDHHHSSSHSSVQPHEVTESSAYALISVTDTGPGLSEDQLKVICSEGVQFNPNELQAGGGSGLGLWISQQIIDLHGGKMLISSQGLGHGATFQICLPLLKSSHTSSPVGCNTHEEQEQERESQSLSSPILPPSRLLSDLCRPKNVLVVDDTPSNRKMLGRILKVNQIKFDEAENGEICLNKVIASCSSSLSSTFPPPLSASSCSVLPPPSSAPSFSSSAAPTSSAAPVSAPFDLILLDYEMPILNGPKTAQKLREMGYNMIIIGVTGNVLPEDRDYFMQHGVDAVLPKPVTIASLMETFEKLCAERSPIPSFA
jgi:CheY-like chemotaxis protein